MWIDENHFIIRCDCGDLNHYCSLWFDRDMDYPNFDELEIYFSPDDAGFFTRIKNALCYIFKQQKFWHYNNVSINLKCKEGQEELENLIAFLDKYLKRSKTGKKGNIKVPKITERLD